MDSEEIIEEIIDKADNRELDDDDIEKEEFDNEDAGDTVEIADTELTDSILDDISDDSIETAPEQLSDSEMEAVGIEKEVEPPKVYTDEEIAPVLEPLEGILFAMGNSVEIARMAEALEVEEGLVIAAADKLAARYEEEQRGVRITRLEDSFQMCTAPDIYEYLIRIAKQPKKYVLTDVLLESLSIVAYKQPITRAEVEKIRGVDCSHAMNKLVEYGLIEEVGRMDAPGRPILFGTTEDFLRSFGVTSLEELPSLNPVIVDEFRTEAENEISLTLQV